jgi:hypothetical protein
MCAMSTYKYSRLGNEKEAIRLIQVLGTDQDGNINLSVQNTTLGRSKFVALSYCWGVEPASHKININGHQLRVRPNLHSFLKHTAKSLRRADIWIDALCIDQQNKSEKSRQIPLMGEIYGKASKVVVWLHDDAKRYRDTNDPKLLAGILGSGWLSVFRRVNVKGKEKLIAKQLRRLLDHEYWGRLWTVQELEYANRIEIYWYQYCFGWDVLIHILGEEFKASADVMNIGSKRTASFMKEVRLEDSHPLTTRFQREFHVDGMEPRPSEDGGPRHARAQRRITSHALTHLMAEHKYYECSVPHDRVYALLPLASDVHHLTVKYSDVPEALLARVFSQTADLHTTSIKTIGRPLGIDIKNLKADITGICRSRSDGSLHQLRQRFEVRMCEHCLKPKTWQTALQNYAWPPWYISVFCIPGTSYAFGTFWLGNSRDNAPYGPLIVSSSMDASHRLVYYVHLDQQSLEHYSTLVERFKEVERRHLNSSIDAMYLVDYDPLDRYETTLDESLPLHDFIRQERHDWKKVKLRLSDWDQLTRILFTATRPFDFYATRKCAALDARSDEQIRKQATREDRTSEKRFRTTPYRLYAEGQYFDSPSEMMMQQWGLPHQSKKKPGRKGKMHHE